jgi:myo-inositol-1(or 4)-monophosphatase
MLQTVVEAARRAGQVIRERYPGGRNVTIKGYRDIVTEVDTAAEAVILDLVRTRFPDHAVLSEEAGGSGISSGYTWVVDPLDGTTNYAHRIPFFSVSIGVLEDGEPVVGVIHDPLRDQMFVAERGKGATLDGQAMHVSRVAKLSNVLMGLDWGHSDDVRAQMLAFLLEVAPRSGTVRALGSAALAQAYVAAGWLDAYFNLAMKPWDTAAGILMVTEAGGRCTTSEGDPYSVEVPDCLVSNGLIHEALLAIKRGLP